jgi:hypothetical protein
MPQKPQVPGKNGFPQIDFVNKATEPLGVELQALVAALEKQLKDHFFPYWGYTADLHIVPKDGKPDPAHWQIVFLDDADVADALGYHDITHDGQPVSKVFVKSTLKAGEKVSVTTSHELLEMLIDPGAQLWAQDSDGTWYAYEACDAVEEETYEIDKIAVCDFVYPAFFESWHARNSVPFDHLGRVSQPFQTLQRGYQIVARNGTVGEYFASRAKARDFYELENRTMHRSEYRIGRLYGAQWNSRLRGYFGPPWDIPGPRGGGNGPRGYFGPPWDIPGPRGGGNGPRGYFGPPWDIPGPRDEDWGDGWRG